MTNAPSSRGGVHRYGTPALLLGLVLAVSCHAVPLAAQATGAIIGGTVRASAGTPLAGAAVRARNESTGFEAEDRADANGVFTFRQLPLGGPYTVTVRSIGFRAEQRTGLHLNLSDRITLDVALTPATTELAPVVIAADASNTRVERVGASTLISAEDVRSLPVANRDFVNLASITPLSTGGTNLAGARGTSTAFLVDGASVRQNRLGNANAAGPAVMSIEAIREFEVSTNEYEVVQGRQGGGAVTVATKFGTNVFEGSGFTYHRNEGLTTRDYAGREPTAFSLYQWGGSLGGPLVRDRLHFFVAGERREERSPAYLFDVRDLADEKANSIARDSLVRFLDILERVYGLRGAGQQVGAFSPPTTNNMLFARVDWQLARDHRLTLRNNYVDYDGGNLIGPGPGIFEAKGRETQRTNTTGLVLRSTLTPSLLNELSLQFTDVAFDRVPNAGFLPVGLVRVRSTLSDGTATNRQLQFGGNRNMPARLPERQLQLVNKSYLELGGHTITFGTDNLLTMYDEEYVAQEQLGRFEFASLADLEARKANVFVRQVPLDDPYPSASQRILDAALFAQTEFQPLPRLTAMLGVRYDVSFAFRDATHNPVLERELGIRTDRAMPVDWNNVLPRLQLIWDVRGDQREIVKLGGGGFSAQPHHAPFYNSVLFNGTQLADITLTGAAVPTPDYIAYRNDPLTIPGLPEGATVRPAQVEMIAPDYELPITWKANLAYSRTLLDRLTLGANLLYARTRNNYQIFNRNLVDEPYFTIEGGRGVFVPASTIAANGTVVGVNNRKTAKVAEVYELGSVAEAEHKGVVLEAALELPRGSAVSASYTYSDARDNNAWNCCLSGTSTNTPVKGDPRDLESAWGPSDWNLQHKVALYGTLPRFWGFQLSGRYVGSAGGRFSLVTSHDINGDGSANNDLAYVFDPDDPSTPENIATAMRKVLDNPENRARECISRQLGRIADRNACSTTWSGRLDVRLSKTVRTWRNQQAEFVVDVFNFANMLDRDWGGQYSLGNVGLLSVNGFDQATQRFRYVVNENAGVVRKSGDPYQIQLGVRYGF